MEKKKIDKKEIFKKVILAIVGACCCALTLLGIYKTKGQVYVPMIDNSTTYTHSTNRKNVRIVDTNKIYSDNLLECRSLGSNLNGLTYSNSNGVISIGGTLTTHNGYWNPTFFADSLTLSPGTYYLNLYSSNLADVRYIFTINGTNYMRTLNSIERIDLTNETNTFSLGFWINSFEYTFDTPLVVKPMLSLNQSYTEFQPYGLIGYTTNAYNEYGQNQYFQGNLDANKNMASSGSYSLTNQIVKSYYFNGTTNYGDAYNDLDAFNYYKLLYNTNDYSEIDYRIWNSSLNRFVVDVQKLLVLCEFKCALYDNNYLQLVYGQNANGEWGYWTKTSFGNTASDFILYKSRSQHAKYIAFDFSNSYDIKDIITTYKNVSNSTDYLIHFVDNNNHEYRYVLGNGVNTFTQLTLTNQDMNVTSFKFENNLANAEFNISSFVGYPCQFSIDYNIVGSQYRYGYENGYCDGKQIGYMNGETDTLAQYGGKSLDDIRTDAVANYLEEHAEPINLADFGLSIFEYPYNLIKTSLDVEFAGINLGAVVLFIIGGLLAIYIIRKVMKG